MDQVIYTTQIILGVLMGICIILQSKGTGLGSTFGGDMGFYGTKRGAERLLFKATIVLATLFLVSSLLGVII